jgi:uncharacterized protein (DUF4415 family)
MPTHRCPPTTWSGRAPRPRCPRKQIDTTDPDAPEVLDWSNAIRGRFYRPTKRLLTLRVDEDVIDWFKREAGGQGGYQTAMNRTLRAAMLRGVRRNQ